MLGFFLGLMLGFFLDLMQLSFLSFSSIMLIMFLLFSCGLCLVLNILDFISGRFCLRSICLFGTDQASNLLLHRVELVRVRYSITLLRGCWGCLSYFVKSFLCLLVIIFGRCVDFILGALLGFVNLLDSLLLGLLDLLVLDTHLLRDLVLDLLLFVSLQLLLLGLELGFGSRLLCLHLLMEELLFFVRILRILLFVSGAIIDRKSGGVCVQGYS